MNQFLGTYQNRLDAKGRVSIPASFRTVLRTGDADAPLAVILRRSHQFPCIEVWPPAKFEELASSLSKLSQFSDEHDDMASVIYTDAFPVEVDKEGRIPLPATLVQHATLATQVEFQGKGAIFQIWQPEAGARRKAEAHAGVRSRKQSLPAAAA